MTNYQDFCKKCIQGKIGIRPDFYIIEGIHKEKNIPKENIDVTIVSPTDQAKTELRQENGINKNEKNAYLQSGVKFQIKQMKKSYMEKESV